MQEPAKFVSSLRRWRGQLIGCVKWAKYRSKHMKKCKVPFTILDQTNHYNYDFSCLGTGKYKGPDGCEVDYLYGENILFLKSSEHSHTCPYCAHFNCFGM